MNEITSDAALMAEFSDEFAGKLAELNHQLIQAEEAGDAQLIQAMFRSTHSLKGLCALAGMRAGSELAHALESVLEAVRSGRLGMDAGVLEAGFATCDQLLAVLTDFTLKRESPRDVSSCLELLERASRGCQAAETASGPGQEVRSDLEAQAAESQVEGLSSSDDAIPGLEPGPQASTPDPRTEPARPGRKPSSVELEMLRIDPARLDLVLNTSGELMVARAQLIDRYKGLVEMLQRALVEQKQQAANPAGVALGAQLHAALEAAEALESPVRAIQRLSSNLQGNAMRLRMVPIGPMFRRFERVLRDACRSTGHDARLVIEGERTELDKKLVDNLIDPLTHLVRNAVDHGIETPEVRLAAGKPARGSVRMEARHESGRVVIRVSDDGRGIDARVVREVLVSKGLMTADQAGRLSEREAVAKIFESGFSTASCVTDISRARSRLGCGAQLHHGALWQHRDRVGAGPRHHLRDPPAADPGDGALAAGADRRLPVRAAPAQRARSGAACRGQHQARGRHLAPP